MIYFMMTFTVTRILLYVEKKIDGPDNYMMIGINTSNLGKTKYE